MEKEQIERLSKLLFEFYWLYNEKVTRPTASVYRGTFTQAQFFVLSLIAGYGTVAMSELAERAQMPKQQITKVVNQLEEDCYVVRMRDSADRRVVRLCLTGRARAFMQQYTRDFKRALGAVFEPLGEEELNEFCQCIARVDQLLNRLNARGEAPEADAPK